MNNKRGMLYLGTILLIFILFLVNAHAQIPDPETIKNDSVIKRVEQLRNFTEENKWDYLSQQWKVLFLKNPMISSTDSFFRKINIVFVILFGRNYDLSFELFFAIALWVMTFLMMPRYLLFLKEEWMRWLGSLAIVVGLANAQLFNFISAGLFKIVFFRYEWYWKMFSVLVLLVILVAYRIFLKYFGQIIKKNQEKKKELEAKKNQVKIEKIVKGIEENSKVDEYGDSGHGK